MCAYACGSTVSPKVISLSLSPFRSLSHTHTLSLSLSLSLPFSLCRCYPLCPNCYNNPREEWGPPIAGKGLCLECPHPGEGPSTAWGHAVAPSCPRVRAGGGPSTARTRSIQEVHSFKLYLQAVHRCRGSIQRMRRCRGSAQVCPPLCTPGDAERRWPSVFCIRLGSPRAFPPRRVSPPTRPAHSGIHQTRALGSGATAPLTLRRACRTPAHACLHRRIPAQTLVYVT